jgi:uncharacterized protein (DUF362 family)
MASRRDFLKLAGAAGVGALAAGGGLAALRPWAREPRQEVFVALAADYAADLKNALLRGLAELGVDAGRVRGKSVLLKPNLVEPRAGSGHINTHPLVVRAAAEAFLSLGAARVAVGEGAANYRDAVRVLEESGVGEVLAEDGIVFHDLNNGPVVRVANAAGHSPLQELWLPRAVLEADMVVSLAKLKTHHWAGATLSMKNLFGVMPGAVYGWPKNALHAAGIVPCVLDVNAAVRPHLAIVDGIVGMEGDGPVMGAPREANVLVMGRNPAAVDATCCRIMGIDPLRVEHLARASGSLGAVRAENIEQRGEALAGLRRDFFLPGHIPALRDIRLA